MPLTNRLLKKTSQAVALGDKLFCAFVTLGYPSLAATKKLILEFEKAGVDILELGFPFSDPLADGPTIQYSSECALKGGVRMEDAFRLVKSLRAEGSRIPIVFFTYLNPVLHRGYPRFVKEAVAAGFDALLIPDLPPEEEPDLRRLCEKQGLPQIFLVAPTTEPARARKIARRSEGFIYYVSLRGVTGSRKALPSDLERSMKTLRRMTAKPVLIGFGVSNEAQARAFSLKSHGVIVGSAVIEKIRQAGGRIESAVKFISTMVRTVKAGSRAAGRA